MSKLPEVRELLTDPAHWTQGDYMSSDGDVTCYCIIGALNHAHAGPATYHEWSDDVARLTNAIGTIHPDAGEVINWNDQLYRKHTEVLALLDKAIAQ